MKKLIGWLDRNLLPLLALILVLFIPLYPKIPLLEAIPGYIVRVRLEDMLILVTLFVWFIQFVRGRVRVHPLVSKIILAYLIFGFLSTISALFLTKTVPLSFVHVAKLYLHFFRRIEYFSLFFILFSAIQTKKQAKQIIIALIIVLAGIALYGYGQKYLYWPVYSTMNREFSKGWKLYLTEHARVPSTFGGHYDAAAFTMMMVTIALSIFFFVKEKWLKLLSLAAFAAGFWLLILTASRTSFIAYLLAVSLLIFLGMFRKGIVWGITRWVAVISLSIFVMLSFGDLSERFTQILGLNKIREKFSSQLFSAKVDKPADYVSIDEINEISQVTSPSDTPPSLVKPTASPDNLPPDVYEDIPLPVAEVDDEGNETGGYTTVSRTYSDNAYKYGLSAAIRFDALWPRAVAGFMKNPLLGSGYSTLTKEEVGQFTEAESTDNDFLRSLGETGLLGFLTFYGAIVVIMALSLKGLTQVEEPLFIAYLFGFIAASIGLLLNAFYIDVFEASKVAEMYWAMAGIALALPHLGNPAKVSVPAQKFSGTKKTVKSKK